MEHPVERKDWVEGSKGKTTSNEMIKSTYMFKDVWNFEMIPAGWYPSSDIETMKVEKEIKRRRRKLG